MPILSPQLALHKRRELVELGFTVIPGVLAGDLLDRLRIFSDELFARRKVDHQFRYQGSDFHIASKRLWEKNVAAKRAQVCIDYDPVVDELVDLPQAWEACKLIGLENQRPDDMIIVLSKPPNAPPLYWHQDMMNWNSPESAAPWPTRIFLSYYTTDTTIQNGCLRVIPGTHLKRIPLHDELPAAHGPEIQAITDYEHHPAFQDHPDAIDLPVKAGDLVINDARVLHAARANQTDRRRTLILQWHSVFNFPHPPTWWTAEIPESIRNYNPSGEYPLTRLPGQYLRS